MKNNISENPDYYPTVIGDKYGDNVDFKKYLILFLSNWYWFAIFLFISVSLAYGINRYSERIFTISSSLLIKVDNQFGGKNSSQNFVAGMDVFNSQQNLINEIGILKSFTLNYRVIDTLPEFNIIYVAVGRRNIVEKKMYKDCPFIVVSDSIDNQPVRVPVYISIVSVDSFNIEIDGNYKISEKGKFGQSFNIRNFNFTLKLRDPSSFHFSNSYSNKFYFYFENKETLTDIYRSKLNINTIEEGASMVRLTVSGPAISREAEYLNTLMSLYIQQGLDVKNQTAEKTIKFIDEQLNRISDSLIKSEGELENFRLTNKVIDLSMEGNRIKTRLESYENEKVTYLIQGQYYNYLYNYLLTKNQSDDIISPTALGINDQGLLSLVKEYSSLQQQKKQFKMNYSLDLPPAKLIEENLITTKMMLLENVKNGLSKIEQSISEVELRIDNEGKDFNRLPGNERKLINIQRKYNLNNTVYTYLLEKKSEADIAKASTVSDNMIIDRARETAFALIKPLSKKNYSLAFFMGIILPLVLIVLIDLLNNKIIDKKDIEKLTKTPVTGYIGHNDSKTEIPVINKPGSTIAESFRAIRTSMRYVITNVERPVISITSTISSEGKTFISVNLAVIYAMLGKKVLLIGLDLRKPRIHKVLDTNNETGMTSYLSGMCEYSEVIQITSVENLFYASSGPVPPNPAELIESKRMKSFIDEAKKEYDFIIIDTPPIAIVSDALLLSEFVDVNLFVVRQRYTSRNTLELIDELYLSGKLQNMGIIINDISLSGYYGYGLRYGYAGGYGYSYGSNYYGKYSSGKYGYYGKGYYKEE